MDCGVWIFSFGLINHRALRFPCYYGPLAAFVFCSEAPSGRGSIKILSFICMLLRGFVRDR